MTPSSFHCHCASESQKSDSDMWAALSRRAVVDQSVESAARPWAPVVVFLTYLRVSPEQSRLATMDVKRKMFQAILRFTNKP